MLNFMRGDIPVEKNNKSIRSLIEEWVELNESSVLFADGFDEAIIGVSLDNPKEGPRIIYSQPKCISILKDGGMTHEEAEEYFSFNVVGAWFGESTPLFIMTESTLVEISDYV